MKNEFTIVYFRRDNLADKARELWEERIFPALKVAVERALPVLETIFEWILACLALMVFLACLAAAKHGRVLGQNIALNGANYFLRLGRHNRRKDIEGLFLAIAYMAGLIFCLIAGGVFWLAGLAAEAALPFMAKAMDLEIADTDI